MPITRTRGIPLLPGFRLVPDHPVLRHLQQTCPRHAKDLLCYYVPFTRRFCIGVWKSRSRGYVQELLSFESPRELQRSALELVRFKLSHRQVQANRNALAGARRQETDFLKAGQAKSAAVKEAQHRLHWRR